MNPVRAMKNMGSKRLTDWLRVTRLQIEFGLKPRCEAVHSVTQQ